MRVFKFGGASLQDADRIRQLVPIVQQETDALCVVVSAIGKTTNELEKVVEHAYKRQVETALHLLKGTAQHHLEVAGALIPDPGHGVFAQLTATFESIEAMLDPTQGSFDAFYDQVVCQGEILSSLILGAFLQTSGLRVQWMDARELIRTDANYRDARIDWQRTSETVSRDMAPKLIPGQLVLTQGFIASAADGSSTTLGREGSDYSAAVFANLLGAKDLSIWKDVPGLQNADPKLFADTVTLPEISYAEVIELSYYGAQVIHPKTIKPLQNKNIPLLVKCFLDPSLPGTRIHDTRGTQQLPALIALKRQQALITVTTRDFSFVTEESLSRLYTLFHGLKIKINLMQSAAISFSCCMDQNAEKAEALIQALERDFSISYEEGLQLLSVRHYDQGTWLSWMEGKQVILEQRSEHTLQVLLRG